MTYKWVSEPPPARVKYSKGSVPRRFVREADAIRSNPDKWLLLETWVNKRYAQRRVSNINAGLLAAFAPRGSFKAVSRTQPDGKYGVYVHYVGE